MKKAKRCLSWPIRMATALIWVASVTAGNGVSAAQQGTAVSGAKSVPSLIADTKPSLETGPEALNFSALAARAKPLLEKARSGSGSEAISLSQYRGHFTMLSVRTKSGGGEIHKHFSDFLFVLEGEGTEMMGGTMVEGKEGANGEIRGTRLDGAKAHLLHKGDFVHIPAGVPHQALEAPGQSIVVYVIKVEELIQ